MNGANLNGERQVARRVSASRMTEPRSMIDLLRARTAKHHRGLESGLQIKNRFSEAEARGPLIAGYSAFHCKTEAALSPHLWDMSDRRSPLVFVLVECQAKPAFPGAEAFWSSRPSLRSERRLKR
jgi:hypothetical protein